MTDDEKILRFAGFTQWADSSGLEFDNEGHPYVDESKIIRGWWVAPDRTEHEHRPDTADLTWLFRWCVPKLDNWSLNTYDTHVTAIVHRGTDMGTADAPKDRPGEALRAAILSLTGEGDGS